MTIGEIVSVIVLIVLCLLDYFGIRKVQKTVDEIKTRVVPR